MIIPPPVPPGGTVALVAPSGPVALERIPGAFASIEALGLKIVPGKSCFAKHGHFAGDDALRAADINEAFANKDIHGIICMRGGYGATRLLPLLNFTTIKANPKPLLGYSDVTALLNALNQFANMIAYHTPMPATEIHTGLDHYSMNHFKAALFGKSILFNNPTDKPIKTLVPGISCGRLAGGNLSVVVASLGTPYEISTHGKIIFLEDIDEPPYKIDRMLWQLKSAGKFDNACGIILGSFKGCEPKDLSTNIALHNVFEDILAPLGLPTIYNVACGHEMPSMSLPIGMNIKLNASLSTFEKI